MKTVLIWAVCLLALAAPSMAAPINLANQGFDFTLNQSGLHRLAFVVMNADDDTIDSVLFPDNQAGAFENLNAPPTALAEVPEPASLALVGFGLTAVAAGLRRRKKN